MKNSKLEMKNQVNKKTNKPKVGIRDGKNHDFFKKIENIEKIENIGYFRYISDFFDIYPIHI